VVGAGIGGLMSALALARHGIGVTLYERDPAPPDVPPADSMRWLRRGVPQSLHPHFFMGRLRMLLDARYPDLVDRLFEAGASENTLSDYLHPQVRDRYRPRTDDAQLCSLNLRRTTFEMVVRAYVMNQPGIRVCAGSAIGALLTHCDTPVQVDGVEGKGPDGEISERADAVIDATGRFSRLAGALAQTVPMQEDQRDSGIWYFTRHYRLLPGQHFPAVFGLPGVMFDDFVVGALPADNGTFTVTFQVYREDSDVARALRDPSHFQAMCEATGALAPWVDPARAEPTSAIHGFGAMDSYWRKTVLAERPGVVGYFCVGDSAVRSNPRFGRGCTWATLAAHALADLLAANLSAQARIDAYEHWLEREFRTDWNTMRAIDRATEAGFEIATGRRAATPVERMRHTLDGWVNAALVTEPELFREVWAGYHGLQPMNTWTRRPRCWRALARSRLRKTAERAIAESATARPSRAALAGA
jgi:2-polyprenyl-6-methoxyphenol hydroxylase-like FAD-dependent oxidoreductase